MREASIILAGWLLVCGSIASASLTDGLVAHYPFDGDAKDASGNGLHGTVDGATLTNDHRNVDNSAYEFDGVDDYIYWGQVLPDMDRMTVSVWVYSDEETTSSYSALFNDGDWDLGKDVVLTTNSSNQIFVRADKNGFGFRYAVTVDSTMPLHRVWRHIVWVMTESASVIYVDARRIITDATKTVTIPAGGSNRGNHNFTMGTCEYPQGRMGWGGYWKGKVSTLRIYNRDLSESEVQDLYNLELTTSGTGPDGSGTGDETVLYVDDDAAADPKAGDISVSDPEEDGTREHPFDSIQEAIGAAADGQKVVVLGGTYWESIDFLGKKITVTGFDPNTSAQRGVPCPVIDGNYQGTVVKFVGGEDANSVLSGFVITRGQGREAGGIFCSGSSPTITDCLIVGNRSQNLFGGGGIYCSKSNAVFDHCTISGNYGGQAGAGFYCSESQNFIANSILWGNTPADIGFPMFGELTPPEFSYSDLSIEAFGPGNIARDPLFVAPGHWGKSTDASVLWDPAKPDAVWVDGNYRLCMGSPCIDAGDPNYPSDPNLLDLDGQPRIINDRVDMGVYEYGSTASVTFAATYKEMSITLVNDPNAPNPDRTYVGHTTIQLNASFKLKLLAQATAVSAAGGTWTVTLNPEIIGPGKNISVELSIRGEDVDVSQISATKGTVVLADVEVGGILAP
ncbi:MAG: right-handed parallel beta-helix repeat-containing protein [Phycisphaerae bacterium]|nr:right-handed parallel beta-helix repeat-containing protein [Phycisphaerae bacterium]